MENKEKDKPLTDLTEKEILIKIYKTLDDISVFLLIIMICALCQTCG